MKKLITKVIIFCLGLSLGVTFYDEIILNAAKLPALSDMHHRLTNEVVNVTPVDKHKISLCFTPQSKCGHLIADEINQAKSTIHMQAYGLTHVEIIDALIQAKQRGVAVNILLDRSNLHVKYSKIKKLQQAGMEIGIDPIAGIAHNKVIIIDQRKIITGSFNFTTAADQRNAENVIIVDDVDIAREYLQNWLSRKAASQNIVK